MIRVAHCAEHVSIKPELLLDVILEINEQIVQTGNLMLEVILVQKVVSYRLVQWDLINYGLAHYVELVILRKSVKELFVGLANKEHKCFFNDFQGLH